MAQGRSTKSISMIEWIRTSRLSTKKSVSIPSQRPFPCASDYLSRSGSDALSAVHLSRTKDVFGRRFTCTFANPWPRMAWKVDRTKWTTLCVSSIILIGRVLCKVTPAMPTWGLSPDTLTLALPSKPRAQFRSTLKVIPHAAVQRGRKN